MSGWDRIEDHWWPSIADGLKKPWPRYAVLMDLRWWDGQVRAYEATHGERGRRKRPGRPTLLERWGWPERKARTLMARTEDWVDPYLGDMRPENRRPAGVQPGSSQGPARVQKRDDKWLKKLQVASSRCPAKVQQVSSDRPHARSNFHLGPVPPHHEKQLSGSQSDPDGTHPPQQEIFDADQSGRNARRGDVVSPVGSGDEGEGQGPGQGSGDPRHGGGGPGEPESTGSAGSSGEPGVAGPGGRDAVSAGEVVDLDRLWVDIQARRKTNHPTCRIKALTPPRKKILRERVRSVVRAGHTLDDLVDCVDWLYTSPCHTAQCARTANGGDPVVALMRSAKGNDEVRAVQYIEAMRDEAAGAPPTPTDSGKPRRNGTSHSYRARQMDDDLDFCFGGDLTTRGDDDDHDQRSEEGDRHHEGQRVDQRT